MKRLCPVCRLPNFLLPLCCSESHAHLRTLKKMDAMLKDFESLYEDMVDAKAEGNTSGYTDKLPVCNFYWAQ